MREDVSSCGRGERRAWDWNGLESQKGLRKSPSNLKGAEGAAVHASVGGAGTRMGLIPARHTVPGMGGPARFGFGEGTLSLEAFEELEALHMPRRAACAAGDCWHNKPAAE